MIRWYGGAILWGEAEDTTAIGHDGLWWQVALPYQGAREPGLLLRTRLWVSPLGHKICWHTSMEHGCDMPFVGKQKQHQPPNPAEQRAERESEHVAEVYVNRRKVGEHRAATRQEAMSAAEADENKYAGARVSIVMRKAPRSKGK